MIKDKGGGAAGGGKTPKAKYRRSAHGLPKRKKAEGPPKGDRKFRGGRVARLGEECLPACTRGFLLAPAQAGTPRKGGGNPPKAGSHQQYSTCVGIAPVSAVPMGTGIRGMWAASAGFAQTVEPEVFENLHGEDEFLPILDGHQVNAAPLPDGLDDDAPFHAPFLANNDCTGSGMRGPMAQRQRRIQR